MWKVLLPGLLAASLLPSKVAHAEMQCGFGCFLKTNEKSINFALNYSAAVARDIPLPPAQLYGWGVYGLMNADEIYDRSRKNGVSLWASAHTQLVKQSVPTIIDAIVPEWGDRWIDIAQRHAALAVPEYQWGEIFEPEQSESVEQAKEDDQPEDQPPSNLWQEIRDGQGGECNISINMASWRAHFSDTDVSVSDAVCHQEAGRSSDSDIFEIFDVCENLGYGGAKTGSKIIFRTLVGKVDDDRFLVRQHMRSVSPSFDSGYQDADSYEVARCKE